MHWFVDFRDMLVDLAHTHRDALVVAAGFFVCFVLSLWLFARVLTRRITSAVFGPRERAPTLAGASRALAQAQVQAADSIEAVQRDMREQVAGLTAEIAGLLEQVQAGEIPITLAVSTPEERQALEATLTRRASVVVSQNRTRRRAQPSEETREDLPTAWTRLLEEDENEEGEPCPTTSESPEGAPKKPAPKKPAAKPRTRKKG